MKTIELVCVNYGNIADAGKVVAHCLDVMPKGFFKEAKIFHPIGVQPNDRFDELAVKSVGKISGIQFFTSSSSSQHLCFLKEVPKELTCDYFISIQWDGFIVRPDLWREDFLDYDYIACPWPLQNIINPNHRVGSGGFCMASKRFAQYWAEHGDESIPNDWERGAVNRKKYEDAGFTFAPLELAAKFGKEHDLEDIKIEEGETFGFHDFRINSEQREKYRKQVYGH